MRSFVVLYVLALGVACKRNSSSEGPATVAARDDAIAVEAQERVPSHDASESPGAAVQDGGDGGVESEARGVQLGPSIDESDAPRREPADDLSRQVHDAKGTPPTIGGRIVVASHRALDQTTLSSPRMVTEFLRRSLPSVKKCYGRLLSGSPGAHGELNLHFAVSDTGSLIDGTAESWNAELSACVRDAMTKWTFPVPYVNQKAARSRFELSLEMKSD